MRCCCCWLIFQVWHEYTKVFRSFLSYLNSSLICSLHATAILRSTSASHQLMIGHTYWISLPRYRNFLTFSMGLPLRLQTVNSINKVYPLILSKTLPAPPPPRPHTGVRPVISSAPPPLASLSNLGV